MVRKLFRLGSPGTFVLMSTLSLASVSTWLFEDFVNGRNYCKAGIGKQLDSKKSQQDQGWDKVKKMASVPVRISSTLQLGASGFPSLWLIGTEKRVRQKLGEGWGEVRDKAEDFHGNALFLWRLLRSHFQAAAFSWLQCSHWSGLERNLWYARSTQSFKISFCVSIYNANGKLASWVHFATVSEVG